MGSHHRDKPQYHRLIEWCVGLQHAAKFFSSSHCILGSVAIEEQTDLEHCRVLQASVRKSTAYRKRSMQPSQKGQYPTNSLPAMTGQKPGRAIRGFARRIGEGVQSSKVAKIFDESPRQSVNQQQVLAQIHAAVTIDFEIQTIHEVEFEVNIKTGNRFFSWHMDRSKAEQFRSISLIHEYTWCCVLASRRVCHGNWVTWWWTVWSLHLPSLRLLSRCYIWLIFENHVKPWSWPVLNQWPTLPYLNQNTK